MSARAAGLTGLRTNLFRRGQCDANTDWNAAGGGVTSRAVDTTVLPPFSTRSIRVTTDGLAANQGVIAVSATGQAAAAGVIEAGSIYFKGSAAGLPYSYELDWLNTDATQNFGTATAFAASGSWQLLTPSALAVAAGKIGDQLRIRVVVNGTRAESFWVAHAMLEKGQSVVAPYIPTRGGNTASRSVGRRWATDTCRRPMRRFAQVWP